ncbi:MAG: protoporphyrinogen oxidase HemJ [Alphaproteobacteria bacterium]|nr:protoporphyrinogen oxidase HemJ [Alphaproteobacteria bacterium]
MDDLYLWVKVAHVIAVMSWMAGILYLPRLFVYHVDAAPGSEQSETFKIMERRLLRGIMNPAMLVVWVTGPYLAYLSEFYTEVWFGAKFLLVIAMTGFHMAMGRWRKAFELGENTKSQKFFRFANEGPTILMFGIVIFVIVKPF